MIFRFSAPSKPKGNYKWRMDQLVDKFVGKLVEVINTESSMLWSNATMIPVIQIDPDEPPPKSPENAPTLLPGEKLKGHNTAWRSMINMQQVLTGKEAQRANPVLVVDVVRQVGFGGPSWSLIVLTKDKYYSIDLLDVQLLEIEDD